MAKFDRFDLTSLSTRQFISDVHGWCTIDTAGLLNNLNECLGPDEVYLEIGSFCGRSLVNALNGNKARAVVIDPLDLKVADKTSHYFWHDSIKRYGLTDRVELVNAGYEILRMLTHINAGVCYLDANHDSGHTYEALKLLWPHMANQSILLVDDYFIDGGDGQTPAPGHDYERFRPVKKDTDRWLAENYLHTSMVAVLPYGNGQALIRINKDVPVCQSL
jgi:predicted O-methyltransferase YrrM